jgi:hypothetical protein
MRETTFVAFGAGGAGAAAGALLVLALYSPAPAPAFDERAMAAAFERAFSKGLTDLRRDVAGLRDALAAPRGAGAAVTADSAPPTRPRAADADAVAEPRAAARRRGSATEDPQRESPFDAPNPPANFARLRPLHGWDDRVDLRRTWLFADEATCLAWFGTPDTVSPNAGAEVWTYNEPRPDADGDGEPDGTIDYVIQFNGGRVFRIDAPDLDDK